jgi:hypothetical protein
MFGSERDPVSGLFLRAVDTWFGAIADLAGADRRFANLAAPVAAEPLRGGQPNAAGPDVVQPMGQAMMIAANRSVSYWLNLAQILGHYHAKSIQKLGVEGSGGNAAEAERLAVDDLRGLLREVGDLAIREARLLQSEFGSLAESVAQSIQPSDQSGAYHRRWRSKI